MILNPNCSEAVMRLKIDNLSKVEILRLEELLSDLEDGDKILIQDGIVDNIKDDKVDNLWYDTYVHRQNIFGIDVIEIKGDAPYNNPDELIDGLRKELKFFKKIKIEIGE